MVILRKQMSCLKLLPLPLIIYCNFLFYILFQEPLQVEARILKIFELSVNISKMIVLERKLRFSLIEGRLRMPPTGMQRQCLRLGQYIWMC